MNGKTFLSRIIDKLLICKNKIQENIFVGQENDELGKMQIADFGGKWISNLNPENGPLSSIKLALEKVTDSSAIMLWPIDHPMIGANTVELLIDTWKKSPDFITVPSDGEHRGHPAIFPSWCFEYFKNHELNNGAKTLLQMFPNKINYVLTDDIWITRNINTPELLRVAEDLSAN